MTRWLPLATLVGLQIAYPLTAGGARAALVVATVAVGCAYSVGHATATRGPRAGLVLLGVAGVGLAVEAVGVRTGYPFGTYAYGDALGPRVAGVPVVVALAWAWMAWPAWLAAVALTGSRLGRVGVATVALAGWDLFLDPQMVGQGYWRWSPTGPPGLPGVTEVPWTNYAGWLLTAAVIMTLLSTVVGPGPAGRGDTPMLVLYLWTYYSSVLAHAVFLHRPAPALWGALGMGLVALPLTLTLRRVRR
jgi:uncharacterized membrane protein